MLLTSLIKILSILVEMLSFSQLNNEVRLGNQMFRYAFLRSKAKELGVKFYCPSWRGDLLFNLRDEAEREITPPTDITNYFLQDKRNPGFDPKAMSIGDKTEIMGAFQSEKYYPQPHLVRQWFSFNPDKIQDIAKQYENFDFSDSVGMHLRFQDVVGQLKRPPMRKKYYEKALSCISFPKNILIFSDDIVRANNLLSGLNISSNTNLHYIKNNKDYEDLYLMTKCQHFICSFSSFCWWGAWLGPQNDRVVVYPQEGPYRPGYPNKSLDTCCENWISLPSLRGILDDYRLVSRLEKRIPQSLMKFFY